MEAKALSTKDRSTNVKLRITLDSCHVACREQISNESLKLKQIWNSNLDDFIKQDYSLVSEDPSQCEQLQSWILTPCHFPAHTRL